MEKAKIEKKQIGHWDKQNADPKESLIRYLFEVTFITHKFNDFMAHAFTSYPSHIKDYDETMLLSKLISAVNQLSRENKLRLIQILSISVAKESDCELSATNTLTLVQEEDLLRQLASTEAVVWSPDDAQDAAKTLSELLIASKKE